MVNKARKEGKVFYSLNENHACMGGSWALGLREITPTLKSGEFYYKLGKYDSWAACKRTILNIPHVESGATYGIAYSPLEKVPFDPTLVLLVTTPKAMLKLAQSNLYRLGVITSYSIHYTKLYEAKLPRREKKEDLLVLLPVLSHSV